MSEEAGFEPHPEAHLKTVSSRTGNESRQRFWFSLVAINSLAVTYYFNYLFFYMSDHFGFGNRENLLLTVMHGAIYAICAWNSGRFAHRFGYLFSLRLGFFGMLGVTVLAGITPHVFGYSPAALVAQCALLAVWTCSICLTWPTLQALLTHDQPAASMPHTAGLYNVVWASTSALGYCTGGALMHTFGGEALFWVAAGLHLFELLMLSRTKELPSPTQSTGSIAPELLEHRRPIARTPTFLHLAWLANPFAYIAINGLLPVIPTLAARLGLNSAAAGAICSVWFWVRLAAFVWFWQWPGWHYRFRWLLAAFIALGAGFTAILMSPSIWMLIVSQVVFGLAVGLIYYSSLFYSMDRGESKGTRGGFHEAAIGVGVCSGPAVGASALLMVPDHPQAGMWAISTVLFLGLIPFLLIRLKGFKSP